MPDIRSRNERFDVCLIVATTSSLESTSQGADQLRHVRLLRRNPLYQAPRPSTLALFPGEYLTNLGVQRDCQRIYCLEFQTSLKRTLTIGSSFHHGQQSSFTAPTGHELRSLDLMKDRSTAIINVHPHFVPRKRVGVDYMASWSKVLGKIETMAAKREELPRDEVDSFIVSLTDTMNRLADLDNRGILSVAALAAAFDDLLKHALDDVFSRSHVVARALTLSGGMDHRLLSLSKLSKTLRLLKTQLTDQFEATERKFLTEPAASDGTDVVPFVLRFLAQPVTRYSSGTAIAVFTSHLRMISRFGMDYVSRLMYFFICEGDLPHLKEVVMLQASFYDVSNAQVFKSWGQCVPAVRLAIQYRHVHVLNWLLFEVQLFPEDTSPPVHMEAESDERLWTIDQLLTMREDSEALKKCRQLVARARKTREFNALTQRLLHQKRADDDMVRAQVEALVPLITHAFDLKWLFTFVALYNLPEAVVNPLFARAFRHVLDQKLVLAMPSAIFVSEALKKAKREGYVTRTDASALKLLFERAHVEGANWVSELQDQMRQTMDEMDDAQTRIEMLRKAFNRLRQVTAQGELASEEHECRKQLLSMVTSLLPMVSPAFSILEQCVSLCDPLAIVMQIQETNADSKNQRDMRRSLLSRKDPMDGVRLQQGLVEALQSINITADDLVEVLRETFRRDSEEAALGKRRGSEEQLPQCDVVGGCMLFQDAWGLFMEQCREQLEQAPEEEPKWFNVFTSVREFFTSM